MTANDYNGRTGCPAGCEALWPHYYAGDLTQADPDPGPDTEDFDTKLGSVPSKIDKSLFSSINVSGHNQVTYSGWPLYYFGADSATHGDNKGVSFPAPGIWHVAVKDLSPAPIENGPWDY